MKIAVVYIRVSTEEQVQKGYSLADQLESCIAKAKELGATKILDFGDEGISGAVLDRPGLSKAREVIRNGQVAYFICLDPDRLARKLSYQLIVSDEIERTGCKLVFVNSDYQDTPEGKLFYSMRGAFAEFEKEKITERLMRGSRQKAKQGKLIHDPGTYGYNYIKGKGKLVMNPREAPVVRMIFEWFVYEQMGYNEIVARLFELGIPTKRGNDQWVASTIKGLIANKTYTGTITLFQENKKGTKNNKHLPPSERVKKTIHPKDYWIKVAVPRIIDDDLFAAAGLQAARVSRIFRKRAQHGDYLMSGLLRCGICGTAYCGHNKRYYVCNKRYAKKQNQERCTASPILRADEIDTQIWGMVAGWLKDPAEFREVLEKQTEPSGSYQQTELKVIEDSLEDYAKQQERLIDLVQQGLVDIAEVKERLAEIKQRELKAKEALLDHKTQAGEVKIPPLADLARALGAYNQNLEGMGFEDRQYIVRHLIKEAVVDGDTLRPRILIPV